MLAGLQQKDKLSEKARPCLHLYTLLDGKRWTVWDLKSQRMIKSRDIIFHEDTVPGLGSVGRKTSSEWDEWEEMQVTACKKLL